VAIEPLTNDGWGFATNCFVCEARNERGLHIPFFHDTDRGLVVAEFALGNEYSGAPTWIHGGVALAILDEAMAWAAIAIRHRWAVTKSSSADFDRPVLVDHEYRLEAAVTSATDETIETESQIISVERGKTCVRARATMSVVTSVQAPALGADPTSDYLRG
jgi:acyl-coenzyme A thioesterase PaaI-like protein